MRTVRRDRFGEVVDEDLLADDGHRCYRGWASHPNEDRPRPCPACKPWLLERPPRGPTVEEREALRARLSRAS